MTAIAIVICGAAIVVAMVLIWRVPCNWPFAAIWLA